MKPAITLISLILAFGAYAAPANVKIMGYNIKNANGMDNRHDIQRVANVISKNHPKVVALQEVDSMTRRSGNKYILGELAERTRMHPFFAPAIDYDGGKYGIGLLSRDKPLSVRTVPLPGREEARAMFVADFPEYTFIGTHLSLTTDDRMKSLQIIKSVADTCSKPLFIAGDFNDTPDSEFISAMKQSFCILTPENKHTFPADNPEETLDYIFTAKTAKNNTALLYSKVIDDTIASDHRPVVAKVRIACKSDKIISCPPYLQNPCGNGITVMWETSVPTQNMVEFGTDTVNIRRARTLIDGQEDCNNTIHKVRLDSIIPGQKYYYRVVSREILDYQGYHKSFGNTAIGKWHEFTLPASDTSSFTALIFNDLHQHSATFRELMKQTAGLKYDFVIFNGDCIDDPSGRKQASKFIIELTKGVNAADHPVFFLRGNHEIRNSYSMSLRNHFDYPCGKTYGAFSWGDTRIVMLDCGEDKPDSHPVYYGLNDFTKLRMEQVDFMKKEFSTKHFKKADKRILIHHIPMWGNDEPNLCYAIWEPMLRKAPFNVSLNAHTHTYAYHPANTIGNPYPVVIGGGYKPEEATVMILHKAKGILNLKVIDITGKELLNINI